MDVLVVKNYLCVLAFSFLVIVFGSTANALDTKNPPPSPAPDVRYTHFLKSFPEIVYDSIYLGQDWDSVVDLMKSKLNPSDLGTIVEFNDPKNPDISGFRWRWIRVIGTNTEEKVQEAANLVIVFKSKKVAGARLDYERISPKILIQDTREKITPEFFADQIKQAEAEQQNKPTPATPTPEAVPSPEK